MNFDTAIVTIRVALSDTRAGVEEKQTKTEKPQIVPLSTMAIEALRRQRVAQAQERLAIGTAFTNTGHIFHGPVGGWVRPHNITNSFRKIARKAGLPIIVSRITHTAVTWMLVSVVDVRSTAGVLGALYSKYHARYLYARCCQCAG